MAKSPAKMTWNICMLFNSWRCCLGYKSCIYRIVYLHHAGNSLQLEKSSNIVTLYPIVLIYVIKDLVLIGLVAQWYATLCNPLNCSPRLPCPWDSSGNDTGVDCHSWGKCKISFQKSIPVGMKVSSLGRLPLWFGISLLNSVPRNKVSSWETSVESRVRSALQWDSCLFCPSRHCWALSTQYCH